MEAELVTWPLRGDSQLIHHQQAREPCHISTTVFHITLPKCWSRESNKKQTRPCFLRHSTTHGSLACGISALAAFGGEDAAFHQNSLENGYAVKTINVTGDDLAKWMKILRHGLCLGQLQGG